VDAAPDEVWAVLADFDRISRWAEEVDHSSHLTEQVEGVGTARRVQVGRLVLVERVTVWDPPHTLAYDLEGLPPVVGGATNRWELRPDGAGTEVTLTSTVDPGVKPAGRLVAPLLARRLAKVADGLVASLAAHLRGAST
jgi:carbon monoxide dehydrogenase subunit G